MSYKVRFDCKSENGDYLVELIDNKNGFVKNTMEVKPEQLPELMKELCKEDAHLLDTIRLVYQLDEINNIIFEE